MAKQSLRRPRKGRPIAEILVGMIASGKSTYAAKRAVMGAIVINDDAIVNAVHHNNYTSYDKRLKPLYKAVENTILQMAITLGMDVVIDRPNYSKAMRRRYIGIAKSFDAEVHLVVFPKVSPGEHARRRANADNRGCEFEHWLKAAKHHDRLYEPPDELEGADALVSMS